MEFSQVVAARHSCRCFLDTGLDAATVRSLVEVAQRAPSWGNTQPWRVWAASGEPARAIRQDMVARAQTGSPPTFQGELKERYVEVGKAVFAVLGIERQDEEKRNAHRYSNCNAFGAPVLVYLTLPEGLTPYAMLDVGSFVNAFCLAASDRGLATCIQATLVHYPDIVREYLPIPDQVRLVVGIALGYPDPASDINVFRSSRVPVDDVLTMTGFESFS